MKAWGGLVKTQIGLVENAIKGILGKAAKIDIESEIFLDEIERTLLQSTKSSYG